MPMNLPLQPPLASTGTGGSGYGKAQRRRQPLRTDWETVAVQLATALGILLALAGLVQLMAEDLADALPLVVIAPLGSLCLWWLVTRMAEVGDFKFLTRVMVAGILLRLGLALLVHYNVPEWFFAPDQVTYRDVGWRTLQYHLGDGTLPWQLRNTAEVGYFYWNALLFWVFGLAPLAPKLVNAFVGTASAIMCYRLAGELAGKGPARLAALLTMFFPSLVLWSALNLRDPIVLLITVALFLAMTRVRRRPSGLGLFGVMLALALLVLFRDYMAFMAGLSILGATFISQRRSIPANLIVGGVLIGMGMVAYQQFGVGAELAESASFEAIAQQRQYMAVGGTAFRPDVDVSTPLRGLQYLPVGLAFFLLSPFPWQIGSALSLMTLPEQLVWFGLMPFVATGGIYLVQHRYNVVGPILTFLVLTTSVYAMVQGNAGTAYRHRAQVMVFLLIMAAVGLTLRRLKKEAARGRGSPIPSARSVP